MPNNSTTGNDVYVIKLEQPTLSQEIFTNATTLTTYPNPVKSRVTIESVEEVNEIAIYTLTGQIMRVSQLNNSIDMSELPKGYYLIKATTVSGKTLTNKVIKE